LGQLHCSRNGSFEIHSNGLYHALDQRRQVVCHSEAHGHQRRMAIRGAWPSEATGYIWGGTRPQKATQTVRNHPTAAFERSPPRTSMEAGVVDGQKRCPICGNSFKIRSGGFTKHHRTCKKRTIGSKIAPLVTYRGLTKTVAPVPNSYSGSYSAEGTRYYPQLMPCPS
jgi:hypothetical protein